MRFSSNNSKHKFAALALSAWLFSLTLPLHAQPGGDPPGGDPSRGSQQGQRGGPIEELTKVLNLTTAQQEQIRQIFERNRPPRPDGQNSQSSDRSSPSGTSSSRRHSSSNSDSSTRRNSSSSSDQRANSGRSKGPRGNGQGGPNMGKIDKEIEAILTPEQKKLFAQLKAQRKSQDPPPGSQGRDSKSR